jgi:hypothetical protein
MSAQALCRSQNEILPFQLPETTRQVAIRTAEAVDHANRMLKLLIALSLIAIGVGVVGHFLPRLTVVPPAAPKKAMTPSAPPAENSVIPTPVSFFIPPRENLPSKPLLDVVTAAPSSKPLSEIEKPKPEGITPVEVLPKPLLLDPVPEVVEPIQPIAPPVPCESDLNLRFYQCSPCQPAFVRPSSCGRLRGLFRFPFFSCR